MALVALIELEILNRSLQSTYQTVACMCEVIDETINNLLNSRTEEKFEELFNETVKMSNDI